MPSIKRGHKVFVKFLITLVLLEWKWMDLFLRENHLSRCWSWLSLLKWIGAFICSVTFLSPEVALYLFKSTIQPCMEYCCICTGAPSCYLGLLHKLQKWICTIVGLSLTASLEPLAHCQNVASLSLFCRYYFPRCSSKLAQLVSLCYSRSRSTSYSDRLLKFSVTITRINWNLLNVGSFSTDSLCAIIFFCFCFL